MKEIREVSNIHCPECHSNMFFSPEHSDDNTAVFHCENGACTLHFFHLRYDECDWNRVMVEKIE